MNRPLLTIAIPTYNRSSFLDLGLNYLTKQLDTVSNDVEIIVSDNCSTDNTAEIVNKYKKTGFNINYIRNEENIGAERNVVQCLIAGKGKFIWIMGDDDYLIPGALNQIVQLLIANSSIGICHIRGKWLMDTRAHQPATASKINWILESDSVTFLRKVHYWITFLTGNIINKDLITELNIDPNKYVGTSLVHLGWTIPSIFSSSKSIIIEDELLVCQGNNTGGYSLIKVFAQNFNKVMSDFIKTGTDPRLKTIINANLLDSFFLHYYKNSTVFKQKRYTFLFKLGKHFWRNPIFWKKYVFSFDMGIKSFFIKQLAKLVYKVVHHAAYVQLEKENTNRLKSTFKSLGEQFSIMEPFIILKPEYMSIGSNFRSLYNLRLEVWDEYEGQRFSPELIIGDNVYFNTDCHIGCINRIVIGNNVLFASRVYISDHFHGEINGRIKDVSPAKRPLYSKGEVIIEDNVWIGEGVCILPGVTIGKNSIVGANAVVTKNFPPNSIIGGVPAKLLKSV